MVAELDESAEVAVALGELVGMVDLADGDCEEVKVVSDRLTRMEDLKAHQACGGSESVG